MTTATRETRLASNKPRFAVCEGNEAAAIGVGLARPDVVAVYPITPQSSLVEHLSQMIADGRLQADLMNVEGEHAVMSGLQGVALAGIQAHQTVNELKRNLADKEKEIADLRARLQHVEQSAGDDQNN